ncbi:hypothetical protein Poli38472_011285 [Pythium oligandrum]|uniref:SSD domain-containing protein n=1 Tax=Pythium oligandrum TaxID=41045 RepID=A0A8K1C1Y1_PYTOL|nr:hypothetical protein Poli38472_014847 [Pythium oligandrum]TMW67665.1 hypothetical protein Poli38472_011285 [Pythium oligandrum]|eukprot:TMW54939.1 hypothetical protein Poli38472_014847 [Pythium oligandrum]
MWVFATVCCALSMPGFRSALEALFAELTVIFLNQIHAVAVATCLVFVAAVALELQPRDVSNKLSSSSVARRPSLWTSLILVSSVLPLSMATSTGHVTRQLANSSVPFSLADDPLAVIKLRLNLTMCKHSKVKECIDNPMERSEFGEYKRGKGQCVTFGSAYVEGITSSVAAIPNQYVPISLEEGYEKGGNNKFSEWSKTNQEQFQLDCPILYNETIQQGQDYLCCTENQYLSLQNQVKMIPGLCTSCKENLRNVHCQMACNPSNSMFLEINQVRIMNGDDDHKDEIFPAIEDLTYYLGNDWIRDIYDFCEADSSFSLLCNPLQNCTDGHGLLDFMGEYKFNSLGSPLQINYRTMDQFPEAQQKELFCPCDETNGTTCYTPMDDRLRSCVGVCGSVCAVDANDQRTYTQSCYGAVRATENTSNKTTSLDAKWTDFEQYLAENLERTDFGTLTVVVSVVGGIIAVILIACFIYAAFRQRKQAVAGLSTTNSSAPVADRRLSWTDEFVSTKLKAWSLYLASGKRPFVIMATMLIIAIVCTLGLTRLNIETDPVRLWVSTSSRPYKERDRFGELFMPFYRAEQVIMIPKDEGIIGRKEYIREAIRVQQAFTSVTYGPADGTYPERVRLEDICWKATGTACTVNSITQYFQNRLDHFDFYDKYDLAMTHFSNCIYSPANADLQTCRQLEAKLGTNETIPESLTDCPCLSDFGSPMNVYNTYLGGFPAEAKKNTSLYTQAKAFVVSALVYNYYEDEKNEPAVNWEREYIKLLKQLNDESELFNLFFQAEISVQDEIERESSGDIAPVALSYALMIVYVSLGINRWSFKKSFFQTSKIAVGFLGILSILLAVTCTIGFFSWCGAKVQLVIMEVVPFLTLAIGVDNIFLLVHATDHKQHQLLREQPELFQDLNDPKVVENAAAVIVSEGVGYIGPSIFMASLAESIAFAFGCINPMPAVLWFAAFACVAVAVNWVLQMTLLLSIMTLDKRRELNGKYDILCCVRSSSPLLANQPVLVVDPTTPATGSEAAFIHEDSNSAVVHFFDRCVDVYTHFLSLRLVKLIVLLLFLLWTCISIISIEDIKHGLPQAESMPSDSYMIDYFNTLDTYLATGPPFYFIVEGGYGRNPDVFDLNDQSVLAKFCQSKDFCDDYSIPKIMEALVNDLDSDMSHIADGVMYSWVDDFWGFVNPDSECCRVDSKSRAYLPIETDNATYSAARKTNPTCLAATVPPVPKESFMSLFSIFSTASAGSMCSYGGGSIYRGQLSIDNQPIPVTNESSPQVVVNGTGYGKQVTAFSYRIFSTSNPTQQDFIDAYAQGRRAADWISEKTGIDVWVYGYTFVFFDQYLSVVKDTYTLVGLAVVAIFVIHAIYFGSLFFPLVVALAAVNIVVQVMGLMHPNDIMLNGLSMVNLIIAAGISVEFCGHFVRMFAKASGTGDERTKIALRKVLTSVLFGITITKIVGLSVLTLADSRIFQKYYFRMYMTVVLCGVLNGMLLLPVVLSLSVDIKSFFASNKSEKNAAVGGEDGTVSPAYHGVDSAKHVSSSPSTRNSNSE